MEESQRALSEERSHLARQQEQLTEEKREIRQLKEKVTGSGASTAKANDDDGAMKTRQYEEQVSKLRKKLSLKENEVDQLRLDHSEEMQTTCTRFLPLLSSQLAALPAGYRPPATCSIMRRSTQKAKTKNSAATVS